MGNKRAQSENLAMPRSALCPAQNALPVVKQKVDTRTVQNVGAFSGRFRNRMHCERLFPPPYPDILTL